MAESKVLSPLRSLACEDEFQPVGIIWARSCKNVSYAICEQQRCRSACASAWCRSFNIVYWTKKKKKETTHTFPSNLGKPHYFHILQHDVVTFKPSWHNSFFLCHHLFSDGLNLTWSKISEDTFSRDVAHLIQYTEQKNKTKNKKQKTNKQTKKKKNKIKQKKLHIHFLQI